MVKQLLEKADPNYLLEVNRIVGGEHWDPHSVLGIHPYFDGKKIIRLWRPGAKELYLEVQGEIVAARKVHEAGIFEYPVPDNTAHSDYRVYHQNGMLAEDPYSFFPTWGEIDSYLFSQGVHYKIFEVMGAQETVHQNIAGVKFAVWAPSATRVSLVGDFNFWDGRVNPMRSMGGSGVWELFVPGLKVGERYKFEIKTAHGEVRVKADPYGQYHELRPKTASIVSNSDEFPWNDGVWMENRKRRASNSKPLNIYEVHLGSWRQSHGNFLNYREMALQLSLYCKEMGYTHVELMPILEHPLDESWGYQVTGFYSVTSRYGSVQDFQFFVDHMHQNGIGVILDWVPGHFPTDDFSLARFDGSSLYEHADPRQGYHPHWNTYIFNYGRREVSNFLLGSALYWIEKMHIDGLRVDAVASMIYLDYGRQEGLWVPNTYGGKENLEAIEFLKHLNSIVHEKFPGVLMIAEESTAFGGVTTPTAFNGLGFDLKWNMGWMNDTLRYFHKDPLYRHYHHNDLTFGLIYAFSEKFTLVLSHDEVVHGKGSLISKMPGDYWQKFANTRLLITYMMCQPGKKMLFMGGEIGQWNEWWCKEEIHWYLLQYPIHSGLKKCIQEMNHLYLKKRPLWDCDFDHSGFEWVNFGDVENSVLCYRRKSPQTEYEMLCVHHFTPSFCQDYFIHLPGVKSIKEVFNSDDEKFGGSGKVNFSVEVIPDEGIKISLAPLATQIFEVRF